MQKAWSSGSLDTGGSFQRFEDRLSNQCSDRIQFRRANIGQSIEWPFGTDDIPKLGSYSLLIFRRGLLSSPWSRLGDLVKYSASTPLCRRAIFKEQHYSKPRPGLRQMASQPDQQYYHSNPQHWGPSIVKPLPRPRQHRGSANRDRLNRRGAANIATRQQRGATNFARLKRRSASTPAGLNRQGYGYTQHTGLVRDQNQRSRYSDWSAEPLTRIEESRNH